jgi:NADPH:quinone reductase-like Zn-dependent oxidoreductase
MKAIVIDGYGDVDQLHLRELPDPRPQADEVLVRVRAAGINPVDWKIRQGQLRFILRPSIRPWRRHCWRSRLDWAWRH